MKSLEKKFKKVRSNVVQSINSKEINTYIKSISDNLSYLMKQDRNDIIKENDNGKYENAYDLIEINENNNINDHILFLALITFHHKQGGVVECTFPPKEEILSNEKLNILIDENNEKINTKELVLEYILNNLVNYCLIDGIHLSDKEPDFFFIHDFPKILYCLSYYIQKNTDNGENNIEDDFQENIRGCIQKSICIVSTLPLFGNCITYENFYTHLSTQMTLYMNQKSLNDKTVLTDIYNKLQNEYCKDRKWLFNIRKAFSILKDDLLIILKLIILERRVVIFSQIPSNVSLLIMTLLSIFPGNYSNGRLPYDEQIGAPFKIFYDKYLIYPLFTLYDLDSLLEKINNNNEINFLIGTTNNLILNNKKLNYSCLINVDEQKIIYGENVNETLKVINGREHKMLINIYDLIYQKVTDENKININNNINNNENISNSSTFVITEKSNKKIKNDEPWILNFDNGKNSDTFYLTKKYIRLYYSKILFDISYLINEMETKNNNDPYNKLLIFHQNIKDSYLKFSSEEISENIEKKDSKDIDKEEKLPLLEELLANPFAYILYTVLPINFDYAFKNSDKNKSSLEKKRESILIKLNNLAVLSEWSKTRNFKKWYCRYKPQIMHYSSLNTKIASVSLYDYDNNFFKGNLLLGKKCGAGEYNYISENMAFSGEYKDDLRNGQGKLSSKDGSYVYIGNWVDGKMEGEGMLYSSKIGRYEGHFHKDCFEGKGKLLDVDKNLYEGHFHKGFKKGKGELRLNDGNIYTGEFKNNKYNGKGVLKDSKGNILQEGEFKDGILVKSKKLSNIKDDKTVKDNMSIISKESVQTVTINPLRENVEVKLYSIQQSNTIDEDDFGEKEEEPKDLKIEKEIKLEEIKEEEKEIKEEEKEIKEEENEIKEEENGIKEEEKEIKEEDKENKKEENEIKEEEEKNDNQENNFDFEIIGL